MNFSANKILATSLASGLAVLSLCAQSAAQFGNLPLWFEGGQASRFTAHSSSSEFVVSASGTEFTLKKANGETASCMLQFVGAEASPLISGDQPLTGKISHFIGNQPKEWQPGVPTFARVRVENVYPGVNVVYYGNQKTLEYDFNLEAGIDPSVIALRFAGADKISLTPQGALAIKVNAGEIVQHAPVAYQMIHGVRQEVAASYKILNAHTAMFDLGNYNHNEPLVIDPVLSYSTYYGGNFGEIAWSIAVNPTDDSVYVAGSTFSTKSTNGIPFVTPNALQTNNNLGKYTGDAFVARFDSTGTNLIYATYLGGSGNDGALSLAVDAAGNAFVAGYTDSTNFPTQNALYDHIAGERNRFTKTYPVDAFVAELNPAGNGLVYSTYIGGSNMDAAYGIALDASENAYITGYTYSTNYPVTPDAFQPHLGCFPSFYTNANAFVSVIAAGGGSLNYSTFLGGTNFEEGRAIAFKNNRVFVAGYTLSTNFPATNNIAEFQYINGDAHTNKNSKKLNGASDAFVTAFDASTISLSVLYSTLLGGTNNDVATAIAADASGSAYVAGFTTSTNFPYTATNVVGLSSFVHTNSKNHYELATNGFLTKIVWNNTNAIIGYSAMFGGKGVNVANGVALDADNNAYVVGSASCTNFPVTPDNISGYLSTTNSSKKNKKWSDAVIIAFNSDCSALLYSAYLGGYDNDYGNAIAVDAEGNAYIAGQTLSTNFPAFNAYQPTRSGTNDMFIAKISPDVVPTLTIAPQPSAPPLVRPNVAGSPPASHSPGIVLKWRKSAIHYEVESCTDITSPNWSVVPQIPDYTNGLYQVTLPTTGDIQFFRLHKR